MKLIWTIRKLVDIIVPNMMLQNPRIATRICSVLNKTGVKYPPRKVPLFFYYIHYMFESKESETLLISNYQKRYFLRSIRIETRTTFWLPILPCRCLGLHVTRSVKKKVWLDWIWRWTDPWEKGSVRKYSYRRKPIYHKHFRFEKINNSRPFSLLDKIKVDSWWRWLFFHCSYCLCKCDAPGPLSDRYIVIVLGKI